jgi:glycosyltransferase involved in cell wall biosynthesis
MKVLILAYDYHPNLGGIARATFNLAEALNRIPNTQVTLLARSPGPDSQLQTEAREFDRANEFLTRRINLSRHSFLALLQLLFEVWKIARETKPDIIVNTLWLPDGVATWLLKKLGLIVTPYVTLTYGNELIESTRSLKKRIRGILRGIKSRVLRDASQVYSISKYTAGLVEDCGVPTDKIQVIYCGVDLQKFHPTSIFSESLGQLKATLAGRFVFFTVARLEDFKGLDTALEALNHIKEQYPKAHDFRDTSSVCRNYRDIAGHSFKNDSAKGFRLYGCVD